MAANDIKAGKAYVEMSIKDSTQKGLDKIEKKLKSIGSSITAIGSKFAAVGGTVSSALLLAAQRFASFGSAINDASDRTGIGAERLQELGFAAEQTGAGMEDVETAVKKMSKVVTEAASGNEAAAASLDAIGLSVSDLKGLKPDEQFVKIGDALSRVSDATARAAAAQDVFGKGGLKLLPMFQDGASGIEAFATEARRLGIVLSAEDVKAADRFGDTLDSLWKQLNAIVVAIGGAIAKALQPFADAATSVLANVIRWIKANSGLVISVLAAAAAVTVAGAALVALGISISAIGSVFAALSSAVGVAASILGALLSPIGLVLVGVAAMTVYVLAFTEAGGAALAWLGQRFGELKDIAFQSFKGISDALAAGDIGLAAKILWTTLKLTWFEGTKELQAKWVEFKAAFVQVAAAAFFGMLEIWQTVKAAIETAWEHTVNFLGGLWDGFIGVFSSAWDKAVNLVTQGLNKIHALWDSTFDADAANKAADTMLAANEQARAQKEIADATAREAEHRANIAQIDKDRQSAVDEINNREQAISAGASANADKDIAALEQQRKELREELSKLREKAAGEKSNSPSAPGGPGKVDFQSLLDGQNSFKDNAKKNPAAGEGFFSATSAAVQSLFSANQSAQERTAAASEKTARNTTRITEQRLAFT